LQLQRKVGDFVEEERAAVSKFKAADFLGERTGKGATFVAEEFGFEQAGGMARNSP